jgi:putative transposase
MQFPRVKTHRGYKYRIYPTEEQEQRLLRWEGALRYLWNLAHEQRLLGLSRHSGDPKRYFSYVDQAKELTELRSLVPWLNDVPCDVCQSTLKDLHDAWQKCFAKKTGQPHFKARNHSAMGLCEPHKKAWSLKKLHGLDVLVFPKLGNLPILLHRPWEGRATSATITRDGDAWFVSILCELDVPDPAPPPGPPVALDRGVANVVADNTGHLEPRPDFVTRGHAKVQKAQKNLSRKKKGSKNRAKAREAVARAHRQVRRQREAFLHRISSHYAKNHSVIVLEDLHLKNMTASARGTVEEPGTNVAQKSGLNRALLGVGLYELERQLVYKAARYGSRVVLVPAAYSSQTCSSCDQVDAANRVSQSRFCCTKCGHAQHADTNAAKVLLKRYEEMNTRRTGGEEVCGGDGVTRPVKQKPKTVRSRTPRKARAKSSGLQAGDGLLPCPAWQPPLPAAPWYELGVRCASSYAGLDGGTSHDIGHRRERRSSLLFARERALDSGERVPPRRRSTGAFACPSKTDLRSAWRAKDGSRLTT